MSNQFPTLPRRLASMARAPISLLVICFSILLLCDRPDTAQAMQGGPLVVVSAASFALDAPIAPNAIVAAFGVNLSTAVETAATNPLPETLAGRSVRVRDSLSATRAARLFFVSPDQINLLIPDNLANGTATVEVLAGETIVASGQIEIRPAAPAIFTANVSGKGVPAANLIRVKPDFTQVMEDAFQGSYPNFTPRPIDLGPEGETVFLVLFPTGARGATNLRVIIGGVDLTPAFYGAQGFFEGLDQVNIELPRALVDADAAGPKEIKVRLHAPGEGDSNEVVLQIARAQLPPVQVTGVTATPPLVARSEIEINGAGFSPDKEKNHVSFGTENGEVKSASETRLSVLVPFGVRSGPISLNSDGREWLSNPFPVRTSLSGIVLDQNQQPLSGVRICRPVMTNAGLRCPDAPATALVQAEGWFVMPDPPLGSRVLFMAESNDGGVPLPLVTFSSPVAGNQDNPLPKTVDITVASGPSGAIGSAAGLHSSPADLRSLPTGSHSSPAGLRSSPAQLDFKLAIDNIAFTLPSGAAATFPDGATGGIITLTPISNGVSPVPFPPNVFSPSLAQITPFGVQLSPGGSLVLPNSDQLPEGSEPALFRYDFASGQFVDTGIKTTVSGDQILTPAGAITETSIYFAALPRQTTTIIGRVVESDQTTPVQGAIVSARGQQATSDGNGGFTLTMVPASNGDLIAVTAVYLRPSGRTDTSSRVTGPAVIKGLTRLVENGQVVPIVLPSAASNRPPVISAPSYASVYANEVREIPLTITELDDDQGIANLEVSGASFATIIGSATSSPRLRLAPTPGDLEMPKRALTLMAADTAGASASVTLTVEVKPLPVAIPLQLSTDENTPLEIVLAGSDVENRPLIFTIASEPANGELSGTPPNITYTPDSGFSGNDSFTFRVSNGIVESAPATVSITVDQTLARWTLTGNINKSRGGHASTRLPDGRVLISGGLTADIPDISGIAHLKSSEIYNPATGSWAFSGDLFLDHVYHTSTLLEGGEFPGHVLVVGGEGRNFNPVSPRTAERYNPVTGLWTQVADTIFPHIRHTATRLLDGRVLIAGGEYENVSNKAEIYNANFDNWTETGELNSPRIEHTATLLGNGLVLVAGGRSSQALNTGELFNPATGLWTMTPNLNQARNKHTATLLADGRVLLAGGENQGAGATAEIYNPATGQWAPAGILVFARHSHTATLMDDGRVLVAGGISIANGGYLTKVEIYDPATGQWSETAEMSESRGLHTAERLANGRVIVAGGDAAGVTRLTSEVYTPGRIESGPKETKRESRLARSSSARLKATLINGRGGSGIAWRFIRSFSPLIP